MERGREGERERGRDGERERNTPCAVLDSETWLSSTSRIEASERGFSNPSNDGTLPDRDCDCDPSSDSSTKEPFPS